MSVKLKGTIFSRFMVYEYIRSSVYYHPRPIYICIIDRFINSTWNAAHKEGSSRRSHYLENLDLPLMKVSFLDFITENLKHPRWSVCCDRDFWAGFTVLIYCVDRSNPA